jgi:hypothetical protein
MTDQPLENEDEGLARSGRTQPRPSPGNIPPVDPHSVEWGEQDS